MKHRLGCLCCHTHGCKIWNSERDCCNCRNVTPMWNARLMTKSVTVIMNHKKALIAGLPSTHHYSEVHWQYEQVVYQTDPRVTTIQKQQRKWLTIVVYVYKYAVIRCMFYAGINKSFFFNVNYNTFVRAQPECHHQTYSTSRKKRDNGGEKSAAHGINRRWNKYPFTKKKLELII